MTEAQQLVYRFMELAGQDRPDAPCVPDVRVQALRLRLHREEAVEELDTAFSVVDLPVVDQLTLIADSIADSLVVILGTAVACGIDIESIFLEVMRSNFTKFIDGHLDAGGKWIKGPSYDPPKIRDLILEQLN